MDMLILMLCAFAQNVSFTLVSRARNRTNVWYHVVAAVLSNAVWFATFRILVTQGMTWVLFVPYTTATVAGSVYGATIAMKTEKWLGATSDGHLKK